jgi:putative Mg2+ transporter-C (MgtC) family protein
VAAIGLAVGAGLYIEAVAATIVILIILAGIKPIEEKYQRRHNSHEIRFKAEHGLMSVDAINQTLGYRARRVTRYVSIPSEDPAFDDISISVTRLSAADIANIVRELEMLPGVREVSRTQM